MLENMNIFSVGGFTFLLLILAIGYYAVEVIGGRNYWYRRIFETYNNNLFDRIMHYIMWWLAINLWVIFWFVKADRLKGIFEVLNFSGKIADSIGIQSDISTSVQLALFICFYFFTLFWTLILINMMIWIFTSFEGLSVKIIEKSCKKDKM
ncbi:MAG: hypothetical protein ACD_78C00462G0004 [uncultured bacterium (gcode 4)]|uniref:Uncharacterized protein n=1 Tax=uncultured bacterium (gcode 4) TaxID=1234023 RepID=K1YA07_9BACT|nr:MAG: hypothetical protein ACD_78C00462G0004 [uncultured bacterium (gcode 4)]